MLQLHFTCRELRATWTRARRVVYQLASLHSDLSHRQCWRAKPMTWADENQIPEVLATHDGRLREVLARLGVEDLKRHTQSMMWSAGFANKCPPQKQAWFERAPMAEITNAPEKKNQRKHIGPASLRARGSTA